jgi:bifunctional UDP-N-acetylglucosamine pyrophosphorylase/glucosamine-1-phosphate N-acetyltransferase
MNKEKILGSIILAAGKGNRMNSSDVNKVTLLLVGKPIVLRIVRFMESVGIKDIVVVVGFAKESVMDVLKDEQVLFAQQTELLGTGNAVHIALDVVPSFVTDIFIVYGDDAVFYRDDHRVIIQRLFQKHLSSDAVCTFLTIEQENPTGLGRIIRGDDGYIQAIIEEKDATDEQRMIKEINPGCFVFRVDFLQKYLQLVQKSGATGEYYLTSLIDLAIKHGEKVETVRGGSLSWRGVNTREDLRDAEKLLQGE